MMADVIVRDKPLSTAEVAGRIGIKPASWRVRVHRGLAPEPDDYFDGRTPYWWETTIDRYLASAERLIEGSR